MGHVIAWCAFAGGWLLVAGPLFQAAIELDDVARESQELAGRIQSGRAAMETPSAWWWLLPPVAYVMRMIMVRRHRAAIRAQMTQREHEQMQRFSEKGAAWTYVAAGASLLAVAATWELREAYDWPIAAFWAILAAMLAATAIHTAARIRLRRTVLGPPGAPGSAAPDLDDE